MPDTEANQARWPQNASQKPGCGFPAAKIVGCFSLGHGGLLAWTLTDQFHYDSQSKRESARLSAEMIGIVASDSVPHRPLRSGPRAKHRRPKTYPLMTTARAEMVVSKSRKLK